jgi:hypothetical protein
MRVTELKESVLTEDDAVHQAEDMLNAALTQLAAAKKGLELARRLPAGENRGKHVSRVMNNLKRIRKTVYQAEQQLFNQQ